MTFRTGTICTLNYVRWRKNRKVYAFILYGGPGSLKTHALNICARELNTANKIRLVHLISKLSKIPAARTWDGHTLYRIFKTYLPVETAIAYRTYFANYITQAAIINYGFNDPASFTPQDLAQTNKDLFNAAGKDLFVKLMNLYTGRGVKMKTMQDNFAKPQTGTIEAKTPGNVIEKITPISATQPAVKQVQKPPITQKGTTGGEIDGYY